MYYYFITGTSRGLGKAICQKILAEGNAKVVGMGRTSSIINPNYHHVYMDLSEIGDLEKRLVNVFNSLIEPEKIVLINNSGALGEVKHIGTTSAAHIIDVMHLNLLAPAILINSFIQKYAKVNCKKTIINISSGAGKKPMDGWGNYCTSKAGLDMFSRVVDTEQQLADANVSIYSIAPGIVDTKMQDHIRKSDKSDFSMIERFKEYKKNNALSSPKEVAEKYWNFLQNEEKFDEVILDVRTF